MSDIVTTTGTPATSIVSSPWYDGVGAVTANGVCDLRRDVKDSEANIRREVAKSEADIRADVLKAESDIRTDVKESECSVTAAVKDAECRLNTNMLTQFGVIREQLIRNEYESKLTGEKVIKELSAVAQHNAERTQDKTEHGFEENEEKLDCFEKSVDKHFFHAREENLEEKVDELRAALTACQSKLSCTPLPTVK